ncbi:hypothetical protein HRR78_002271 [Exophiala dermatitidis]|nr:hypothetical protein HRR75_001883 [Exophiala dermatitidis]KAJ4556609.1 hypothetical protein HRR78_002271 [Exophiala dermatitidis]
METASVGHPMQPTQPAPLPAPLPPTMMAQPASPAPTPPAPPVAFPSPAPIPQPMQLIQPMPLQFSPYAPPAPPATAPLTPPAQPTQSTQPPQFTHPPQSTPPAQTQPTQSPPGSTTTQPVPPTQPMQPAQSPETETTPSTPRRKRLTRDQRRDILLMRSLGYTYEQISKHLHVTMAAVHYACTKAKDVTPQHHKAGRKPRLSKEDEDQLEAFYLTKGKKRKLSCQEMAEELWPDRGVSAKIIRHVLDKRGHHLKGVTPRKRTSSSTQNQRRQNPPQESGTVVSRTEAEGQPAPEQLVQ